MPPTSSTTTTTTTITPHPPTHSNLLHIISHLVPPRYPLPPHLLSTPIKTRHLYLPPPIEDKMDDAYITQPERVVAAPAPAAPAAGNDDAGAALYGMKNKTITDRLFSISMKLEDYRRSIDLDRVQGESGSSSSSTGGYYAHEQPQQHTQQQQRQQARGRDQREIEDSLMGYVGGLRGGMRFCRKDRETLLAKVRMGDDLNSLAGHHPSSTSGGGDMGSSGVKGTMEEDSDSVDLVLLYEPEDLTAPSSSSDLAQLTEESTTDRSDWKLYNVVIPTNPSSSSSAYGSGFSSSSATSHELDEVWSPSIPVERGQAGVDDGLMNRGEEMGAEGEVGEMGGQPSDPDDFWGGYDEDDVNEDRATENAMTTNVPNGLDTNPSSSSAMAIDLTEDSPSPPPTARPPYLQTPTIQEPMMEDDSYWASYGSVEDGLRPSNPPTPGAGGFGSAGRGGAGVAKFFTPSLGRSAGQGQGQAQGERDYWGTGGETPVGWSPPVKEIQLYPEEEDEERAVEPVPVQASTAGSTSNPITSSLPLLDSASTAKQQPALTPNDPSAAERQRRKETLKSTLSALRAMYAGDEQEWRDVLREVGGGV